MGKDATFSTGCTKEMIIALNEQQKHPDCKLSGRRRKDFSAGANMASANTLTPVSNNNGVRFDGFL
jgi:hypothetical protein